MCLDHTLGRSKPSALHHRLRRCRGRPSRHRSGRQLPFASQALSSTHGDASRLSAADTHRSAQVRAGPSVQVRCNRRQPRLGWWYAVHSHQPGPGVLQPPRLKRGASEDTVISIRALESGHAKAFSSLRRRVAAESTVGLGLTLEEELARPLEEFSAQLASPPPNLVLGAFDGCSGCICWTCTPYGSAFWGSQGCSLGCAHCANAPAAFLSSHPLHSSSHSCLRHRIEKHLSLRLPAKRRRRPPI
jgi:hypothetical protein